jgi:hypothetical protein
MSKRIVIVGLLVIGVVAMLGTEATAQIKYCFGCGSGDKCQLTFRPGGLFTGSELNDGLVTVDCNNRADGGRVIDGDIVCKSPGGNVAPGRPVQGNTEGTFSVEEVLTSADIHGSRATKTNDIEVTFADPDPEATSFCKHPPTNLATEFPQCSGVCNGSTDACDPLSTASTSCYDCFKLFFGLPSECIGCPNCKWTYFAIDYNDHCVNFKVKVGPPEDQDVVLNMTGRCRDPGNINLVDCPVDRTNCPGSP